MEADLKKFQALPPTTLCRVIDFTSAEVRPGFVTNTYILIVEGMKPWLTSEVELHPLIYIRQPEYWGIEVVGCLCAHRPAGGNALPCLAGHLARQGHQGHRGDRRAHSRKQIKIP
jgi:hypothetical protein